MTFSRNRFGIIYLFSSPSHRVSREPENFDRDKAPLYTVLLKRGRNHLKPIDYSFRKTDRDRYDRTEKARHGPAIDKSHIADK